MRTPGSVSIFSSSILGLLFILAGGCIPKKKPNLTSDAGISIPLAAAELGFESDFLLAAYSKKNLEKSAKPGQLVAVVKSEWRDTLPLKLKSGDVKTFRKMGDSGNVTAVGAVEVNNMSVAKSPLKMRDPKNGSENQFEVIRLDLRDISSTGLSSAINSLHALGSIVLAEPNYEMKAIALPNDPKWPSLWGMEKIAAPAAWETWTGDPNFTVAVIDTGIDYNHEDLKESIWKNTKEIAANNIDDDGNGYVDDVMGWNFYWANNNPMDGNGHGTHCAGTIAGKGNNAIGVAGVSWNAKLMPVKVLSDSGSGYNFDIYEGILYAVNNGAKVTSNSYGGGGASSLLATALSTAQSKGVLFIAAAGNEATAVSSYPAYYSKTYDNVISIASTDRSDGLSSFSNYGDGVNIAAPGSDITSTVPNNGYQSYSGTSMATPHVAGLATLIWSKNPNLTYLQVKDAILTTGDAVPALAGKVGTGARINAKNALDKVGASPSPTPSPTTPAPTATPTPVPTTPAPTATPTPVPTTPAPTATPTPVPTTPAPTPTPSYKSGVRYSYFITSVSWADIPNFDQMAPMKQGVIANFNTSQRTQTTNYGFSYKGFIRVPRNGTYTFYTSSDDGSRLSINNTVVVENGGTHSLRERSGTISLSAGYHEIRVDYFQATANQGLTVSYQGPRISKQKIPNSALFYQ